MGCELCSYAVSLLLGHVFQDSLMASNTGLARWKVVIYDGFGAVLMYLNE